MDDVLKRLGVLECQFGELRADVRAIAATLPHLATKADFADTRAEINGVRADIHALEAKMLRWMIGTMIGISSVAFTVAKFVN